MDALLQEPDWNAPLDMDAVVAAVPDHMTVKGMSITAIGDALVALGKPVGNLPRCVAFKDYPQKEMVRCLVVAAREGFPGVPPRMALRRIGGAHLSSLKETMIMRVMLAGLGSSLGIQGAAKILPRIYRVASSHEEVAVPINEARRLRLQYKNAFTFPHSFQVGVIEGGLGVFNVRPRILVQEMGMSECVVEFSW